MITHKGTVPLETARLRLRRFLLQDAQLMYQNWASDERVTRFLTWTPHGSAEDTKALLKMWCGAYIAPDVYHWAMEFEGQPIGGINVVRKDDALKTAHLGYCMGFDWWNRGLMTEAAAEVTRYLTEEIGYETLFISHAVGNPASGRVAQKCGYVYVGRSEIPFARGENGKIELVNYAWKKKEKRTR